MRLWSLHPRYLDSKGLVALWREGLLAQAVLAGKTRGYKSHPQLARFLRSKHPREFIAFYLRAVHAEAVRRGYHFNAAKIERRATVGRLPVARGQLAYEWRHLSDKLKARSPRWLERLGPVKRFDPHPSFRAVAGGVESWEKRAAAGP